MQGLGFGQILWLKVESNKCLFWARKCAHRSVTSGSAWPHVQEIVCLMKLLVGQGQIVFTKKDFTLISYKNDNIIYLYWLTT